MRPASELRVILLLGLLLVVWASTVAIRRQRIQDLATGIVAEKVQAEEHLQHVDRLVTVNAGLKKQFDACCTPTGRIVLEPKRRPRDRKR